MTHLPEPPALHLTEPSAPSAEEKIRRTIARFCHFTDKGDFDNWVRLFADDGCIVLMGQEHRGHAALRAFIELDQPPELRGLHFTTDSIIEIAGGEARVSSNFIFVADGKTASLIVAAGRYHDILVEVGEEWLFARRETELVGSVASEPWGAAAR